MEKNPPKPEEEPDHSSSSDSSDSSDSESEEKNETSPFPPVPQLSDREKRLLELRQKYNKCRKDNRQDVLEEERRNTFHRDDELTRHREQWTNQKLQEKKEASERNLELDDYRILHTPVEKIEAQEKKKKRKKTSFGWEVFNQDAQVSAYKKRVKQLNCTQEEYEKKKEETPDFYRDANSLEYGASTGTKPADAQAMINELHASINKRKGFSRRRSFYEEADVDYINRRNHQFNKKISRAFDKYTIEVKQNLERGTAV